MTTLPLLAQASQSVSPLEKVITLLPGEVWWGGRITDARLMPFDSKSQLIRRLDSLDRAAGNQAQPLLISNKGRVIWSETPFTFEFARGSLLIRDATSMCSVEQAGVSLASAFAEASRRFFPPAGKSPALELFATPQYNTWIELLYEQTQERILRYARSIIEQGYPPGVLMIDDNWQEDYGVWEFSSNRFTDPKAMNAELHTMGFHVMLWVCPFVSPDCETYRHLQRDGVLLRESGSSDEILWANTPNDAAMIRWWNGVSAVLDLSNPKARSWFKGRLDRLVTEYGVDGFKFDAGDSPFYLSSPQRPYTSFAARAPEVHTMDFAEIGLNFPFNEYRACWRMAGAPLAQRLRDKDHSWESLRELIPGILAQGVLGYAFTCPDMIGGGLASAFENPAVLDTELVVRSAQVHALMPMMQFSVAPWRVLPPDLAGYCREAADLHASFAKYIAECVKDAATTGAPIVRPLEWTWPDRGYEHIIDQFMLGERILVAPVVEKGVRSRSVNFPPGRWVSSQGQVFIGPSRHFVDAPLDVLPYFQLSKEYLTNDFN